MGRVQGPFGEAGREGVQQPGVLGGLVGEVEGEAVEEGVVGREAAGAEPGAGRGEEFGPLVVGWAVTSIGDMKGKWDRP